MLERVRSRLTYANVVSTLCLFALLGGGAYAASQLPKNSVGSKQIKRKAVRTSDLANDAVTSPKVKAGTLLGSDFAPGELPSDFDGAAAGGALNGTYPNPGLAGPEGVHVIGDAGEPAFASGASNITSEFVPAGFYKDPFDQVSLQGTVSLGGTGTLFTLPAGYRPPASECYAAPAFTPALAFTFDRICVYSTGSVAYERGTGTTYISLDGITFRGG